MADETNANEAQRKKIALITKWAIVGVVCLVIGPLATTILAGALGMAAIGVVGVAGWVCIEMAPWFAMKVANVRMKAIMKEAEKNPIETMNNVFAEQSQIIRDKDNSIMEFEGSLADYNDKVIAMAKRYPEDAARFQDVVTKMKTALASMKRKQALAKDAQREYKNQIDKAKMLYDMALATARVTALSQSAQDEVFMDIKKQISFDTVNHKFNTAVAALSQEVDDQPEYNLLPSGDTISATAKIVNDKVTA